MGQKKSKEDGVVLMGAIAERQGPVRKFKELEERIKLPTYIPSIDFTDVKLQKVLGRGGNRSTNYESMWDSNGKKCVFKVSRIRHFNMERNPDITYPSRELFLLDHKGLVKMYGVSVKPPRFGAILEYVNGYDIRHFLLKFPETTFREKQRFVFELLDILKYIEEISPLTLSTLKLKESRIFVEILPNNEKRIRLKYLEISISYDDYDDNCLPYYLEAPERGEKVSMKTCVYQFAVMVYMILTNSWDPYIQFSIDYPQKSVSRAIVGEGLRPIMDESIEELITNNDSARNEWMVEILKSCWKDKMEERPCFNEIYTLFGRKIGLDENKTLAEKDNRERVSFLFDTCANEENIFHNEKDTLTIKFAGNNKSINVILKRYVFL